MARSLFLEAIKLPAAVPAWQAAKHLGRLMRLSGAKGVKVAIAALVMGSLCSWNWMDPLLCIVGGLVIACWSLGLIQDIGRVLFDYVGGT